MRRLFEEYGDAFLTAIASLIVLTVFFSSLSSVLKADERIIETNVNLVSPLSEGMPVSIDERSICALDSVVFAGEEFDPFSRVTALNSKGEDIASYFSLKEEPDTSVVGDQELTYRLYYNGESRTVKAVLHVIEGNSI